MQALALHDARWARGQACAGQPSLVAGRLAASPQVMPSAATCHARHSRVLLLHSLPPPCTCQYVCSKLASDVGKAALRRQDIFADETGDRWKPVAGGLGGCLLPGMRIAVSAPERHTAIMLMLPIPAAPLWPAAYASSGAAFLLGSPLS